MLRRRLHLTSFTAIAVSVLTVVSVCGRIVAKEPQSNAKAGRRENAAASLREKLASLRANGENQAVNRNVSGPTKRDVAYRENASDPIRNALDVYAPNDGTKLPVVVWIHGGAWKFGDKKHLGQKAQALNARNMVVVSINYRFSPEVDYREMTSDIAAAIHWVHDHASEFRGDPEKIFLMGHSAGAHLAALVGIDQRYLNAEKLTLKVVKGVILLDGAGYDIPAQMRQMSAIRMDRLKQTYTDVFTSDPEKQRDASPLTHVTAGIDTPPFLILHVASRADSRMQSTRLGQKLTDSGVKATVVAAEGKTHATINRDIGTPDDKPTQEIYEFLDTRLKELAEAAKPKQ